MIEVEPAVVRTLRRLTHALGGLVLLVGGRAVQCRLRLARYETRVTLDIDILLDWRLRPARQSLATIPAVQDDPLHPCRLTGAGLDVDLLTGDLDQATQTDPGRIVDDDGLVLLVPPFVDALVLNAEASDGSTNSALTPRCGSSAPFEAIVNEL
jgi:hypothetical protein